mgnify:CR=1 FL=1
MAQKTWKGGDGAGTEDYSVVANWVEAAIPTTNDTVTIPANADYGITAGLDQSAVAITSFEVEKGFSKNFGTDTAFLQITCTGTAPNFFKYEGSGTLARIDLGASAIAPEIRNTGSPNLGEHALELKGTAMTALNLFKGHVGLGVEPDDITTECDAINVAYINEGSKSTDAVLYIGKGVKDTGATDIQNIRMNGGQVFNFANVETLDVVDGEYHQVDGAWVFTANFFGQSSVFPESDDTYTGGGSATATTLYSNAVVKLVDPRAKTFTKKVVLYSGTGWHDPLLRGTYTAQIEFPDGIDTVDLRLGKAMKITPAAI